MSLGGIGGALGLGTGRVARAMAAELARAVGASPRVVAVGEPLGKALAQLGARVIAVAPSPRRKKRAPPTVAASVARLPLAAGAVDAVCAAGMPVEGVAALAEFARVVRPGGVVSVATAASALVRRVAPPEVMAACLMHALLVDVEQKQVGATLLTSGRVRRRG